LTDPAADAARSAAIILSHDLGSDLPVQVEAALATRGAEHDQNQYAFDPVSIAILIVAVATLAWTIYNDLHERTHEPPQSETIARQLRITLRDQEMDPPPGTERVTEVVATEIIRHAAPHD
jgi:hypothetical protein